MELNPGRIPGATHPLPVKAKAAGRSARITQENCVRIPLQTIMDFVPVLNFPAMSPVPFKKALWMIHSGAARPVGAQGSEHGIELLFSALDTAIASDKGNGDYASSHSVAGKVRIEVSGWDGNDPFKECSAVMMRGITGRAASYY